MTKLGVETAVPGASTPAQPRYDLVGPENSDDVRRLIQRYGAEKVKAEINRQTALKPGMKSKDRDWIILQPFLEEDARHWLAGRNPIQRGHSRSIANWFAKNHPDKDVKPESIWARIYRKLVKHRRYYMLVNAFWASEASHPYQKRLDVLRELCSASKNRFCMADCALQCRKHGSRLSD
jgi:hypothetical protein